MKRKHLERAARQAIVLAADLDARLPACCAVPAEDLFAAMWPTAVRLERLERRARTDRKHARRYRRAVRQARREVEALLASQDSSAASVSALLRTVPFSAGHWHVGLVPGMPVPAPEREAA
jgi:hypothetical protein